MLTIEENEWQDGLRKKDLYLLDPFDLSVVV
jgi:hypothetical protein